MDKSIERRLERPGPHQVKIWFQGETGSGKTLLADLIREALEARGLVVRGYRFGGHDYVPPNKRMVDLTDQNIDDVLTVEVDHEGLTKLLEPEEAV